MALAIDATAKAMRAAGVTVYCEYVEASMLERHDTVGAIHAADLELEGEGEADASWLLDAWTIALNAVEEFFRNASGQGERRSTN